MTPAGAIRRRQIQRYQQGQAPRQQRDQLSSEEPLEIRLVTGPQGSPSHHPLTLTMRTPGHDYELAAGLLFSEGLIQRKAEIVKMLYCVGADKETQNYNVLQVRLHPELQPNLEALTRFSPSQTSCGLCGKVQIEQLQSVMFPDFGPHSPQLSAEQIYALPEQLPGQQPIFARTGGVHAAALFDTQGQCLYVAEDVGRHNALDKLIGYFLLQDQLPLLDKILLLSGRTSYDMIQKALRASIPVVAAVGAPSSLAVELAASYDQTLIGFLKAGSFNVYSGFGRLC